MNIKSILYIIIPFLFSFSCEQKEDQIINDLESRIAGEWVWVKSTYYNTASGQPFVLTPDSVGFALRQIFLGNGSFYVYKNDLIETTGLFWLESSDRKSADDDPAIRIYTQKNYIINFVDLKIVGDSLILDNTTGDGTVKLFKRMRPGL